MYFKASKERQDVKCMVDDERDVVFFFFVFFLFVFVFFFQAEDGIRDYKVTGVQTCALPI